MTVDGTTLVSLPGSFSNSTLDHTHTTHPSHYSDISHRQVVQVVSSGTISPLPVPTVLNIESWYTKAVTSTYSSDALNQLL